MKIDTDKATDGTIFSGTFTLQLLPKLLVSIGSLPIKTKNIVVL